MFYVLTEIGYFSQILRTRPDSLVGLRESLESLANGKGGLLEKEHEGRLLFRFPFEGEEFLPELVEFLTMAVEVFDAKKKVLQGYSLVVDNQQRDEPLILEKRLLSLLYLTHQDNKIWFSNSVKDDFKPFFSLEEGDYLAKTDGLPILSPEWKKDILGNWEVFSWFSSLGANLEQTVQKSVLGIFSSAFPSIVTHLLGHQILKKGYKAYFFYPNDDPLDPWSTLKRAFSPEDQRELIAGFNEYEKGVWEQNTHWANILSDARTDFFEGDFYYQDLKEALAFFLGVATRQGRGRTPAVFLWVEPDQDNPDVTGWLTEQLQDREDLPVLLVSASGSALPALRKSEVLRWRGPAAGQTHPLVKVLKGMVDGLPSAVGEILQKDKAGEDVFAKIMNLWDKTYLTILLLALDVFHWEGEQHLEDFLVLEGHERALIKERMKRLIDLQILSDTCRYSLVRPKILEEVLEKLGSEAQNIQYSWGRFLLGRWENDSSIPRRVLWNLLQETKDYHGLAIIFQSYSERGLHRFNPQLLETWQNITEDAEGENAFPTYETLLKSYHLRQGLLESPMNLELSLGEKVNNLDVGKGAAHWQLQKGRFHLRKREADAGMIPLKSAFFLSQEQEESIFEIQSSMEIGNALMAKKRIEEAREYFEIGQSLAGACGCPYWVFRAEVHESIASFLWGDLTRSRFKAAEALNTSFTLGRHEEKVFLMFLLGRCEFELGRYENAYEYFKSARDVTIRYKLAEARSVILLWEGRAQIYRGEDSAGTGLIRRGKDGLEKQFFLSESYYFKGNYPKALSLIIDGDWSTIRENDGQISLVCSWATGMSNLEDRLIATAHEPSVMDFLIQGFEAYLMGLTDREEEASITLQSFITKKDLAQVDPYAHLYALWKGLLTIESEETTYRSTVFGRGLRTCRPGEAGSLTVMTEPTFSISPIGTNSIFRKQ
jgi:tetratricopeptide (TPR) repeat protein